MDGGLRELSSPLVRQVGRGEQEDGLNAEGVERDEVVVHDLAGERVRRLEGEHEPADQPEGENERGERAYRPNHGIAGTLTPTEVLSM